MRVIQTLHCSHPGVTNNLGLTDKKVSLTSWRRLKQVVLQDNTHREEGGMLQRLVEAV